MKRAPCALGFYPGDLKAQIESFLAGFTPPADPAHPVAGVVPHAGWIFSGAVAAKVFSTLCGKGDGERTFVLLGAVHRWGVSGAAVYAHGAWDTPLGAVAVDEDLAGRIVEALGDLAADDAYAHDGEHSIEVQVPLLRHLAPRSRIVPIAVPPTDEAAALGARLGEWAREAGEQFAVVASTDLTHYGRRYGMAPAGTGPKAEQWMKENDRRIIDLALRLEADAIVAEAETHHNACGAGAMAASVAFAKALGRTRGHLVEYTTSHDVMPEGTFSMAVGYAGLVF